MADFDNTGSPTTGTNNAEKRVKLDVSLQDLSPIPTTNENTRFSRNDQLAIEPSSVLYKLQRELMKNRQEDINAVQSQKKYRGCKEK